MFARLTSSSRGCGTGKRVSVFDHQSCPISICGRIGRRRCREAVEHAEDRSNEHGIVNLEVRRPGGTGASDVSGRHGSTASLHGAGNGEQGLYLLGERCGVWVPNDGVDQRFVAEKADGSCRVTRSTEGAVVERRDVRPDQFTFGARQAVRSVEQALREVDDWPGDFRMNTEEATNTWSVGRN